MIKMTKTVWTAGLCLVGLLFAGCTTSGPKIETELDPTVDFSKAKTFYVLPLPERIPGADPGILLRLGPAALNAVEAGMWELGYQQVMDINQADIAVYVHGKAVPKTDITDWGFAPYAGGYGWYGGYPYGGYYGSSISVDQYDEGTLIVEVYDVETSKMIWVGWRSRRASEDKTEQVERVTEGVTGILARYPAVGMGIPTPEPQ